MKQDLVVEGILGENDSTESSVNHLNKNESTELIYSVGSQRMSLPKTNESSYYMGEFFGICIVILVIFLRKNTSFKSEK